MKPRKNSKSQHKFRFVMTVHDVIFPKSIIAKVRSSKFYVVLSRANKKSPCDPGSIDENGEIVFEEQCELEATLVKNRKTNEFMTKHCRIILKQIKPNNNKQTKESSVGSIKFDLVDYAIKKKPSKETTQFTKCNLDDVYISFTIKAEELELTAPGIMDDSMSIASCGTVKIDNITMDFEDEFDFTNYDNENNNNENDNSNINQIEQYSIPGPPPNEPYNMNSLNSLNTLNTLNTINNITNNNENNDINYDSYRNDSYQNQQNLSNFRIQHAMDAMNAINDNIDENENENENDNDNEEDDTIPTPPLLLNLDNNNNNNTNNKKYAKPNRRNSMPGLGLNLLKLPAITEGHHHNHGRGGGRGRGRGRGHTHNRNRSHDNINHLARRSSLNGIINTHSLTPRAIPHNQSPNRQNYSHQHHQHPNHQNQNQNQTHHNHSSMTDNLSGNNSHAMIHNNLIMNNLHNMYYADVSSSHPLYDELVRTRKRVDDLEEKLKKKEDQLQKHRDEELDWSAKTIEWQREKSGLQADNIEFKLKLSKLETDNTLLRRKSSECTLKIGQLEQQLHKNMQKYGELLHTLHMSKSSLKKQIAELTEQNDDLEQTLLMVRNSWTQTGNVMEHQVDQMTKKLSRVEEELRDYKEKYNSMLPEYEEATKRLENVREEKYISNEKLSDLELKSAAKLVEITKLRNELIASKTQCEKLQYLILQLLQSLPRNEDGDILIDGINEDETLNDLDFHGLLGANNIDNTEIEEQLTASMMKLAMDSNGNTLQDIIDGNLQPQNQNQNQNQNDNETQNENENQSQNQNDNHNQNQDQTKFENKSKLSDTNSDNETKNKNRKKRTGSDEFEIHTKSRGSKNMEDFAQVLSTPELIDDLKEYEKYHKMSNGTDNDGKESESNDIEYVSDMSEKGNSSALADAVHSMERLFNMDDDDDDEDTGSNYEDIE